MAGYKIQTYRGVTYGLKKGETVEQLAELPDLSLFICGRDTGEVKRRYFVSTPYGLRERNQLKRPHRKRGFIRGDKITFPRQEGEPEVSRPKLGKGSGKAGGGRSAAHTRSHIKGGWVPAGTSPEDCYICKGGLRAAIRYQNEQFFNWQEDRVFQAFDQLPEELWEKFEEPLRNRKFISRWKALEERVRLRYLRFAIYWEKKTQSEQKRRQWEREKAEQEETQRRERELEDVVI